MKAVDEAVVLRDFDLRGGYDDNLFREQGNNSYDLVDVFSEFIDNSLSARCKDKVEVTITAFLDEDRRTT